VIGDLVDEAALGELVAGADAVVHAAGAIRARSRADFHATNAVATARLGRLAAAAGPRRFVYVSSLAAREPRLSAYAASKRAGEEALAGLSLATLALRPPVVYGPWDEATLVLFRLARAGLALRPGRRDARLAFVHVEDLARAVVAALPTELTGTFAIDDGHPGGYGWDEALAHLARAVGVPLRVVSLPAAVALPVAGIAAAASRVVGRAPLVTWGKAREAFHPDWTCENDRLRLADWSPRHGLAEGFAAAAGWYRAEGLLRPPPHARNVR
jgi:nucleoside-diphosphate-sugar epimerase